MITRIVMGLMVLLVLTAVAPTPATGMMPLECDHAAQLNWQSRPHNMVCLFKIQSMDDGAEWGGIGF